MRNHSTTSFTKGDTIWPVARVPAPVVGGVLVRSHLTNGTGTKGTGYDRYVYDITAGGIGGTPATAILTTEGGNEEDVMQTVITNDEWWQGGGSGYTFRDTLGVDIPVANVFGGHTYRIVYLLNTIDFGQRVLVWNKTCEGHESIPS